MQAVFHSKPALELFRIDFGVKPWVPLNSVNPLSTNNHCQRFRYRQERRATVIWRVAIGPMAEEGGAVTVKVWAARAGSSNSSSNTQLLVFAACPPLYKYVFSLFSIAALARANVGLSHITCCGSCRALRPPTRHHGGVQKPRGCGEARRDAVCQVPVADRCDAESPHQHRALPLPRAPAAHTPGPCHERAAPSSTQPGSAGCVRAQPVFCRKKKKCLLRCGRRRCRRRQLLWARLTPPPPTQPSTHNPSPQVPESALPPALAWIGNRSRNSSSVSSTGESFARRDSMGSSRGSSGGSGGGEMVA